MLYIYKYIILRKRKMHTILKKRVAFHLQEMKISPPRAAPRWRYLLIVITKKKDIV